MNKFSTSITTIKVLFFLFVLQTIVLKTNAATYRNLIAIQDETPSVADDRFWIDSDTAPGETAGVEISYTPSGGGATVYLKILGTFDNTSFPGANWKVDATFPVGSTNGQYQLFTRNQLGSDYGFSGFTNLQLVLPVTFTNFNYEVKGNQIQFNWATGTEINNSFFEIERSEDGMNWQNIAKVNAIGNSSVEQNYSVTDFSTKKGTYFFRLSQIDLNGRKSYHNNILKVNVIGDLEVSVFPNPAADVLKIIGLNEAATLTIFDEAGAKRLNQNLSANLNTVNIKSLKTGIYFASIKTKTTSKTIKFFVQ